MNKTTQTLYQSHMVEEYILSEEPFYLPVGDEIELFQAAYAQKIPILLKGPTGVGKTRFVEYMSYKLGKPLTKVKRQSTKKSSASHNELSKTSGQNLPLVTIA